MPAGAMAWTITSGMPVLSAHVVVADDANHAAMLAQVRQYASFDYRIPAGNPQRDWFSVRAGLEREDIDAGVGSTGRVGVAMVTSGQAASEPKHAHASSQLSRS